VGSDPSAIVAAVHALPPERRAAIEEAASEVLQAAELLRAASSAADPMGVRIAGGALAAASTWLREELAAAGIPADLGAGAPAALFAGTGGEVPDRYRAAMAELDAATADYATRPTPEGLARLQAAVAVAADPSRAPGTRPVRSSARSGGRRG
jgi:hypothetical protein